MAFELFAQLLLDSCSNRIGKVAQKVPLVVRDFMTWLNFWWTPCGHKDRR